MNADHRYAIITYESSESMAPKNIGKLVTTNPGLASLLRFLCKFKLEMRYDLMEGLLVEYQRYKTQKDKNERKSTSWVAMGNLK